jgi:uncharacterized phage-associated protein
MASVFDVSGYILQLGNANDNEGYDLITNLKMQKLVYYSQGFYLAMYNSPLFNSPIEAWEHGPVCPELYRALKIYQANPLPAVDENCVEQLSEKEIDIITEVYGVYGQYSAWRLREMTHQESPWLDTPLNQEISHKKMKDFFKTQLTA